MNWEGALNVVILRLAKRAEGPLKCNPRFPAGSKRKLQLRGSSPSLRLGMTRVIVSIDGPTLAIQGLSPN